MIKNILFLRFCTNVLCLFLIVNIFVVITGCNSKKEQFADAPADTAAVINDQHKELPPQESYRLNDDELAAKLLTFYKNSFTSDIRMQQETTDSSIILDFYEIPDGDDYERWIYKVEILQPFTKKNKLEGDLNNDGKDDIITLINTEGGKVGGNVFETDLIVFLQGNRDYNIVSSNSIYKVSGCDEGGWFIPVKISGGYLSGETMCYAPGDSRWSPSLKYKTKLILQNNELVFHSKSEIPIITVYGRPGCSITQKFIKNLKQRKIDYNFYNVDLNEDAETEMWRIVNKYRLGTGNSITFPVVTIKKGGKMFAFEKTYYSAVQDILKSEQ